LLPDSDSGEDGSDDEDNGNPHAEADHPPAPMDESSDSTSQNVSAQGSQNVTAEDAEIAAAGNARSPHKWRPKLSADVWQLQRPLRLR
jgi:hypothetical protein